MKTADDSRAEAFCREVWSETVRLTARVILDTAFGKSFGENELVDAVCAGRGTVGLAKVALSPAVPVVAVGGPVRVYYGEVARRLSCEMVFPPFFDVANAVGAATGVVAKAVTVMVEGDGSGLFRVMGPAGSTVSNSGAAALAEAEAQARAAALSAAREAGAQDPQIEVSITQSRLPDAVDENGLLEATVRAEAIGRPETATRDG
jgi:hypothetical protein